MKAPPVLPPNAQPSRIPRQLAIVALCLLIPINALTLVCSVGIALATDKLSAVAFGSVIFVLIPIAMWISSLAVPAVGFHQDRVWPWFVVALGFAPFPLTGLVCLAVRLLRMFAPV